MVSDAGSKTDGARFDDSDLRRHDAGSGAGGTEAGRRRGDRGGNSAAFAAVVSAARSARPLGADSLPDEARICPEVLRLLSTSTDSLPDFYADSFAHSATE